MLAFIILFPIVVFVHELGHFLLARRAGVKVEAFAIGMGRKIFGWRDKHGTEWRLNIFPIGGYATLKGQADSPNQVDARGKKLEADNFEAKSVRQKFGIIFAGPAFNYVFGFLIFFALFALVGAPKTAAVVNEVLPNAAVAGVLHPGLKIVSVNGEGAENLGDIVKKGAPVELGLDDGRIVAVQPRLEDGVYKIGVSYSMAADKYEQMSFGSAITKAGGEVWRITSKTLSILGEMLTGARSSKELGGIISIAKASERALESGLYAFLFMVAFISISLGFFNLLPIPILDGGYLFIYIIEGIIRRPLPKRVKDALFWAGFGVIVLLMIIANGNDIMRLFK
ncbi:MAG: M50 family metallopeptidase [Rickettsiales bacterium]|nr:M50 family metallopeptidase [Rickettsiales bacterium]